MAEGEVLKFFEFEDGRWEDSPDKVRDAGEREEGKEREVSDGGWNWNRFRKVKVLEIKVVYSVGFCV